MDEPGTPVDSEENRQYLNEHNLQVYFEDAIVQMFLLRQESNKIKPVKFFKEYFCSLHQGTHILFREFLFISATPYNRLCVMKAVMQIYKPLLFQEEKLNSKDYHSLLQLVWPDFPISVIQDSFAAVKMQQKDDLRLSFLDFVGAMKNTFCTGAFDYESEIIYQQLKVREEEFSKISKEEHCISEQGDRYTTYLSEADFLCSLEDNGSDQASTSSLKSDLLPYSEFKKVLSLRESNSFSSDEPAEKACDKLSRSSSGSKDALKSEPNISVFSRASTANIKGRLSGKQLSNSLNLLQTDRIDTENQFSIRRHRSKSAVAIQRSSPHGRP